MDFSPVRDTNNASGLDQSQAQAKRISNERQMIARLDPKELQNRYITLYDDHFVLKQHARSQEDKIKKLATKIAKLIEEKKKLEATPFEKKVSKRNVEQEDLVALLQSKLSELQEQNKLLKQRVSLAQQQAQAAQSSRKVTIYDGVSSRIDTGQPKRIPSPLLHNMRVVGPSQTPRVRTPGQRNQDFLLDQARTTNQELEESLRKANEQLGAYEQDIEQLRQQLRIREQEFEQNLLRLKSQTSGIDSRQNLQENIDMIRLQRDLREKNDESRRFQNQIVTLESENRSMKTKNAELLRQIERLSNDIQDEQSRVLSLRNELRNDSRPNTMIEELQSSNDALRRECELLREAHMKISASAFNADREQEFREKERALRLQIAQLEATIRADMGERGVLLDRLTAEKNTKRDADETYRSMHLKYLETKEKYDDLLEKMKFFERGSDIDMKEIEEAMIILRQRKERRETNFDFLEKVDDEKTQNLNRKILDLETQLAETAAELEKTRNILSVQYKLNKDYKLEVECTKRKLDENQSEYSSRILESGQLLDIRANRIQKLQKALQDVAYGTRPVNLKTEPNVDGELNEQLIDDQIELERGETLIEIHLSRVEFTDRALDYFGREIDPATFCSVEFYEHELEMTPVIKGPTPEYDFTTQYRVKVDDYLLQYLQNDHAIIEIHQTVGQTYKTVAACKLSLKHLIDDNEGRIIRTAQLVAAHDDNMDIGTFAYLHYWIRLRVPLKQSFRLLKEKLKAEGYLVATNLRAQRQSEENNDQHPTHDNANELTVSILNCSRVKGSIVGRQPDLYCVYKFYDFEDHVTVTIPSSNSPSFDDRKLFPVTMDADLDRYLKDQQMVVYVFDDQDKREQSYLARASIALISLAHNEEIKGIFQLFDENGDQNGTIDIVMRWNYRYTPPLASTRTPSQRKGASTKSVREPLALLPDESISGHRASNGNDRIPKVRVKPADLRSSVEDPISIKPSDSPKKSLTTPGKSITKPQPSRQSRSSSNASTGSKRVSFDRKPEVRHSDDDEEPDNSITSSKSEKGDDQPEHPTHIERVLPDDSDSDILYIGSSDKGRSKNTNTVQIGVDKLTLFENCKAFTDENCEKVFVSPEFLSFPAEDLETPYSLKIDAPNTEKNYGFLKELKIDNAEKKQELAALVAPQSNGDIQFIVVCEPPESVADRVECVDIGFSVVNAKTILEEKSDIIDEHVHVYNIENPDEVIGEMTVTVSILGALNTVLEEKERKRQMRS